MWTGGLPYLGGLPHLKSYQKGEEQGSDYRLLL